MNIIKKFLPFILVIGLSYWAVASLFIEGFFPMHDDTQVQRVHEMRTALGDGMFPVRWVPNLGYSYGYPIFNFYAPLAYYVGGAFMLLGFDALAATKLMMGLGFVLAGVSMYFLAKEFWGRLGGILSALLYVYAPYHALQIYVRGDVAEFWGYAFIPLAFLGIYRIYSDTLKGEDVWSWVLVGSVGYAGIILSHNLTAMMVTPFLFSFALVLGLLWNTQKGRVSEKSEHQAVRHADSPAIRQSGFLSILKLFSPLLLGILLASFYWLPTLVEMKHTDVLSVIGGGSDFGDHFVCPIQLWESPWGFAGSASGCEDGMSFKAGKLHIALSILSLLALLFLFKARKKEGKIIIFFVVSLALSAFLMLEQSKLIWDTIPKMDFFQFPWRFLIIVSFMTSLLGGSVLLIAHKRVLALTGALIVAVIFLNVEVFTPQTIVDRTVEDYTNKENLVWATSKTSDEYMPAGFSVPQNKDEIPRNKIIVEDSTKVISLNEKVQRIEVVIDAPEKTKVVLNIAYFPAWHVYINGVEMSYQKLPKGLLVEVPAGKHTLIAVFEETPIEKLANFLSFTGVLILIIGIISSLRAWKKGSYDKKTT